MVPGPPLTQSLDNCDARCLFYENGEAGHRIYRACGFARRIASKTDEWTD